jgi:hypothetical protein
MRPHQVLELEWLDKSPRRRDHDAARRYEMTVHDDWALLVDPLWLIRVKTMKDYDVEKLAVKTLNGHSVTTNTRPSPRPHWRGESGVIVSWYLTQADRSSIPSLTT